MITEPDPSLPNGVGRSHGTSRTAAFDRWFRYPAGFARDAVMDLFDRAGVVPGQTVVDPFAGAGIVGTVAAAKGLRFYGIEAHPLVAELAGLKLTPPPGGALALFETAKEVTYKAKSILSTIDDKKLDREAELVRRSFTNEALRELIAIRQAISFTEPEGLWMKWALLGTLRDVACVSVGWPYQRPNRQRQPLFKKVFTRFNQRVAWMAEDIHQIAAGSLASGDSYSNPSEHSANMNHRVVCGDSRQSDSWSHLGELAPVCVSSPPYLNNFDYADATRLELYFLGEVTTWSAMCKSVRANMLIATTQQTKVMQAQDAWDALKETGVVYNSLREIGNQLGEQRSKRPRGKEYDLVLPSYFIGLAEVLRNLSTSLSEGGKCYWIVGDSAPYGVYINTPDLIALLGEQFGFQSVDDITIRRRGARWASNGTRHQVPLAERLVIMRRTSGAI
jgi:hypothetical protein